MHARYLDLSIWRSVSNSTIIEWWQSREWNSSWTVWTKCDKRSYGRWETFLVNTVHTQIALVACCAGFYDCKATLLGCSLEAKLIAFSSTITKTTCVKRTWRLTTCKNTGFFRRLLHYWVCTKVVCVSLLLMASRELVSSIWHQERAIRNDGCKRARSSRHHARSTYHRPIGLQLMEGQIRWEIIYFTCLLTTVLLFHLYASHIYCMMLLHNVRKKNNGCACAYSCISQSGVKTETISP